MASAIAAVSLQCSVSTSEHVSGTGVVCAYGAANSIAVAEVRCASRLSPPPAPVTTTVDILWRSDHCMAGRVDTRSSWRVRGLVVYRNENVFYIYLYIRMCVHITIIIVIVIIYLSWEVPWPAPRQRLPRGKTRSHP